MRRQTAFALLILLLLVCDTFNSEAWKWSRRRRRRRRSCQATPRMTNHYRYRQSIATRMWIYAGIAYVKRAQSVLSWSCEMCSRISQRDVPTRLILKGNEDTKAVAFYDARLRSAVVSFRGTVGFRNWLNNVNIRHVHPPIFRGLGRVHAGFYRSYIQIRTKTLRAVRRILEKHSTGRVYVTGHSLGAAMATIAAPDFRNQLRKQVFLYTFGSPRVGDSGFVRYFVSRMRRNTSWRCYNSKDKLARSPPCWLGFQHVPTGKAINQCNRGWGGFGKWHSCFFNLGSSYYRR